jgi:hypothetical protein
MDEPKRPEQGSEVGAETPPPEIAPKHRPHERLRVLALRIPDPGAGRRESGEYTAHPVATGQHRHRVRRAQVDVAALTGLSVEREGLLALTGDDDLRAVDFRRLAEVTSELRGKQEHARRRDLQAEPNTRLRGSQQ